MNWNIAQAKQHFSEVVRQAGREPQVIYNRNTPVAAIVSMETLTEYQALKAARQPAKTLFEEFAELRQIMQEEGLDGLEITPRTTRPNPFADMLDEEGVQETTPLAA